jgi:isopenicillin-N epimerase
MCAALAFRKCPAIMRPAPPTHAHADDHEPMTDSKISLTRRDLLAAGLGAATLAAAQTAQGQPEMPSSSRELWRWVRTQSMIDLQIPYLDAASVGPTLRAAMAAEYRARETQSISVATLADSHWSTESNRLATRFASFLGCDADELLFTRGAGEALGKVAAGLDLLAGDEVITTSREHPAALSPWLMLARRRGIVVKQIDLPAPMSGPEQALGLFAGAVTERTKVIAFSHVQYADGAVLPVPELCSFARQRNILSVVDGAQAVGMLDFTLRDLGCDFYGTCFHKWLGGSHGTGALFVRREMLDRLWPIEPRGIDASPPVFTPTQSVGHETAPAALHRLGNIVPVAWPALRGVETALDFQQQVLRNRIEARVRELAIYARLRLQQLPSVELLTPGRPGLWAGILTFRAPGKSAPDIATALTRSHRVHIRHLQWPGNAEGALRASFHVFNSHDDIEKLMQGLQLALR